MILNLLICVTCCKAKINCTEEVKYAFGAAFCTGVSRDRYLYLLKRRVVWFVVSINIAIQTKEPQPYDDQQTHSDNFWHFKMFYESPTTYLCSYNQNIPTLSWDLLLVYIKTVYLSFWPVLYLNWPLFYPVPSSGNKTIWSQSGFCRSKCTDKWIQYWA